MIKWKKIRDERGAAEVVEAAFLYPVIFMVIFFLIYVGFYIIQQSTLESYAQKVATIAAREVAYPGYLKLSNTNVYKNGAVELGLSAETTTNSEGNSSVIAPRAITVSFDTSTVKTDAYRYWSVSTNGNGRGPLSEEAQNALVDILAGSDGLVTKYGFMGGKNTDVSVTCDNYVISQTVTVRIEQDLMNFGVLHYFGIDMPQAGAVAKATVGDSDELIRNTDFVLQVVETLANKLGIDVNHMKTTVKSALEKVGLL